MVSGTLGIRVDTKKSEIGKYFSGIAETMKLVKGKLNDVVKKNGNYGEVKMVVEQFISGTLDKIAEGAKEAGKGAIGDVIGNATATGHRSYSC